MRVALIGCIAWTCVVLAGCGGQPSLDDQIGEATSLMQVGRLAQAKTLLHVALNRDPYNAQALYVMGRVQHAEGNLDQAIYYYQCALSSDPAHAAAAANLKRARQEAGATTPGVKIIP